MKTFLGLAALALGAWLVTETLRSGPSSDPAEPAAAAPAETPPADPTGPIEDSPSELGARRDPVEGAEHDAAPQPAAEPGSTWILTGTTQRGFGEQMPGVEVHLRLFAGAGTDTPPLREHRLRSDASGRFRWPLPPPTSTSTVEARAPGADHLSSTATHIVVPGEQPPELALRLYPLDTSIVGQVRDELAEPLAGVEVRCSSEIARTDEQGHYQLRASSARSESYVSATAAGYAQQRAIATTGEPGKVARVDFQLLPSAQIVGRVVDEHGAAVEGALVQTFFTHEVEARTEADGRFHLDHLDPLRETHHVYARKEGYVEAGTQVSVEGRPQEIPDLVLKRGVHIEGVVLGPDQQALEGAELYLGFSPSAYNRLDARSDAQGAFAFPHAPTGSQTLHVSYPGLAPQQQVLQLDDERARVSGLVIRLEPGHFIGGRVQTEDGEGLAEVWVSVRHADESTGQRATTDEQGRFRLDGLPAEEVSLGFYRPGLIRERVSLEQLDHDTLEVVLQASARVAGRVIDGTSGEPLQEFLVRFDSSADGPWIGGHSATWSREGHRFTDTDGYWDSGDENLTPGGVTAIEVRAEGYAVTRLERVVASVDPDPEQWILRLYPGATIRGRVVDDEGRSVSGVRLQASPESSARSTSEQAYRSGQAVSGEDGGFEIASVAPGSTALLVEAPDRPPFVDGPFDLNAGAVLERPVVLPTGCTIHGRLREADGRELGGEEVNLYVSEARDLPHFSLSATTDEQGAFVFEHLTPGLYQLSHTRREGTTSVQALTRFVRITEPSTSVTLQAPGSFTIRGVVLGVDGGAPPAIVAVNARAQVTEGQSREEAPPSVGVLARDGRFEIHGLLPGEYQLFSFLHDGSRRLISGGAQVEIRDADATAEIALVRR